MSKQLQISLQIVLGLNCNFACKHCLNSSRPNYDRFDLGDEEILFLADVINLNENVSTVAFNGGEPLLYLAKMIALKKRVRRDVSWTMTSNGSKIPESLIGLKELKLNAIVLSFDKYHQSFFSEQDFKKTILQLKIVVPRIEINFVYENLEDLQTFSETFNSTEVTVIPTRLIKSGRAKDMIETHPIDAELICPNVRPNLTKVTYFPKRGFTVCCGPLLFDHNLENLSFFSQTFSELLQSFEFKSSIEKTVESEILKVLAANVTGEICTRCTKSTNSLFKNNLSNETINLLNRKFLSCKDYLNERTEKALNKSFHVKYFIALESVHAKSNSSRQEFDNIEVEKLQKLSDLQISEFRDFTLASFYDQHPAEYDARDRLEFITGMQVYFEGQTETVFFRKQDRVVGVLTLYYYENHPLSKSKAYHIGYWGYDRNLVTRDEARQIKNEWFQTLVEVALNHNIPVVGLIDYFNSGARKMIKNFGFELKAIRLDKRP